MFGRDDRGMRLRQGLRGRRRLVALGEVDGIGESLAKLAEAREGQILEWVKKAPFTGETHTLVCFVDRWDGDPGSYHEYVFAIPHESEHALRGREITPDLLAELRATWPCLEIRARPAVVTGPAPRP